MDTVWLLQDASDYYGPDFHAVFATEEAARAYMEEADKDRYPTTWQLEEVPVYAEPPLIFTVHTVSVRRILDTHPWPAQAQVWARTESAVEGDPSRFPKVTSSPHFVRAEAPDEDEAKRLFAEEMRRVTSSPAAPTDPVEWETL